MLSYDPNDLHIKSLEGRVAQLEQALLEIGNLAHDASTGPAVPDTLWEIRNRAYYSLSSTQ